VIVFGDAGKLHSGDPSQHKRSLPHVRVELRRGVLVAHPLMSASWACRYRLFL
jgi:hypothetical protein